MANYKKLTWDANGERFYEQGVDQGVLYVMRDTPITEDASQNDLKMFGSAFYTNGVAWNGLTQVSEAPEGGDPTDIWADNIKYLTIIGSQKLGGSMECYTYPNEFNPCIGYGQLASGVFASLQARIKFGFVYRTMVGSDLSSSADEKIHIVYGCYANAPTRDHSTINDSPEAQTMSFDWTADTFGDGYVASGDTYKTASIEIQKSKVGAKVYANICSHLFGRASESGTTTVAGVPAHLLLPNEVEKLVGGTSAVTAYEDAYQTALATFDPEE